MPHKPGYNYRPATKIRPERVIGDRLRVLLMRYGYALTDEQRACCEVFFLESVSTTQIGMVERQHALTVRSNLIRAIRRLVGAAALDLNIRGNDILDWLYGNKDYIFYQGSENWI